MLAISICGSMQLLIRMPHVLRAVIIATGAVVASGAAALGSAQGIAQTPPLGWNSWDAFGLTINEADYKANVRVLAELKRHGWQYAVVDEGWYMENPFGDRLENRKYVLDAHGRLVPAV